MDTRDRDGFTLTIRGGWVYSSAARERFVDDSVADGASERADFHSLPDVFGVAARPSLQAGGTITHVIAGEPYADYRPDCKMFLPGNIYVPHVVRDPMFERQKASVFLRPWCSAALVTPTHILTAAHCVTDGGDPISIVRVAAATKGNIRAGADVKANLGFAPGTSIVFKPTFVSSIAGNDIAVVQLSTPFRGEYSTMCLSEWNTKRKLAGLAVRNLGYPEWDSNCRTTDRPLLTVNPVMPAASEPQKQTGSVYNVENKRVTSINLAVIGGLSGSPLFHCGTCSAGERSFIVGVLHGMNNFKTQAQFAMVGSHITWLRTHTGIRGQCHGPG